MVQIKHHGFTQALEALRAIGMAAVQANAMTYGRPKPAKPKPAKPDS